MRSCSSVQRFRIDGGEGGSLKDRRTCGGSEVMAWVAFDRFILRREAPPDSKSCEKVMPFSKKGNIHDVCATG